MAKLIVFLGNPGIQYKNTRHNTAWLCCDRMVEKLLCPATWQTKFHSLYSKQGNAVFLKPQTFMNESGIAVQEAAKFFNIQSSDIIVVHDDIELKFGETKLQLGGGMGGHNGLRSAKKHLGTDSFVRLRIGVGRPPTTMDVATFVLSRFTEVEQKLMEGTLDTAIELLYNKSGLAGI